MEDNSTSWDTWSFDLLLLCFLIKITLGKTLGNFIAPLTIFEQLPWWNIAHSIFFQKKEAYIMLFINYKILQPKFFCDSWWHMHVRSAWLKTSQNIQNFLWSLQPGGNLVRVSTKQILLAPLISNLPTVEHPNNSHSVVIWKLALQISIIKILKENLTAWAVGVVASTRSPV